MPEIIFFISQIVKKNMESLSIVKRSGSQNHRAQCRDKLTSPLFNTKWGIFFEFGEYIVRKNLGYIVNVP